MELLAKLQTCEITSKDGETAGWTTIIKALETFGYISKQCLACLTTW